MRPAPDKSPPEACSCPATQRPSGWRYAAKRLRDAALSAWWRQWRALGASLPEGGGPAKAVVDLEALILMSLAVQSKERRLGDAVAWWGQHRVAVGLAAAAAHVGTPPP